jgi:hypothetical protein
MLKFPPFLCQGALKLFFLVYLVQRKEVCFNHFNICHLGDFQSPHFPNMGVRLEAFPELSIVTQLTCVWGVPALNARCENWLPWKSFLDFSITGTSQRMTPWNMLWSHFLLSLPHPTMYNQSHNYTKYIDDLGPLALIFRRIQLKSHPRDWLSRLRFSVVSFNPTRQMLG